MELCENSMVFTTDGAVAKVRLKMREKLHRETFSSDQEQRRIMLNQTENKFSVMLPFNVHHRLLVWGSALLSCRVLVACVVLSVAASLVGGAAANKPPRFLIDGQTEIVIRLKEGPESPIGEWKFLTHSFVGTELSYMGN